MIKFNVSEQGQMVVVLLLIMLVSLTVGLAVTQRSITSVTTSTHQEQSSRAFSAAEAGIEQIRQSCLPGSSCTNPAPITLSNNANATVIASEPLPPANQALEYPPVGKEDIAQFWLANPAVSPPYSPCTGCYSASSFQIYFGNSDLPQTQDYPAIEVNVITYDGTNSNYLSNKYYYDSEPTTRSTSNGFKKATCNNPTLTTVNLTNTNPSPFYCAVTVPCSGCTSYKPSAGIVPVMVRTRLLYSNSKQKIALLPAAGNSLPPQASIYTSIGSSGLSQKTIRVFKMLYVVPVFFDFAIFSAGDITK